MLSGYKTYILSAAYIAAIVMEGLLGVDIPGLDLGEGILNDLLLALGLSTVRSGIANS